MYKDKKVIAVIPARGGSKGVKNKNIKHLCGKPLIAYTIETAFDSNIVDEIFVSTDSIEIADISKKLGVKIIERPDFLATDSALGIDVIKHSIKALNKQGLSNFYFLYLQPTSPLREKEDIINSLSLAFEKNATYVVSVCECEHNPLLCNTLENDLSLENFISNDINYKNRQSLNTFYRVNGAVYLIDFPLDNGVENIDFYGKNSYAYIMPQDRSVDIDSILDFALAEVLINERKKH